MFRRTPDPEIPHLLLDEEGRERCWLCDALLGFDDSLTGPGDTRAEAFPCTNGDCDAVLIVERTASGGIAWAKWGRIVDEVPEGVCLPTYIVEDELEPSGDVAS